MSKMIDEPLVSIIVAMYKGEKYIKECIESIVNQDYERIELILVDDGSPDNCGRIAESYAEKDDRISVLHQKNAGVSAARNEGIKSAKGLYIGIVDQDDILSADYVSYFLNLIKKHNADIALTPTADKFFDSPHKDTAVDHEEEWSADQAVIEMLYHKVIIAPWNKIIRRNLLIDNDIRFNEKLFGGEGFAFSLQAYQYANRIAVGNKKVYHYRVGDPESGASKFRLSSIESSLNAQEWIKETLINPTKEIIKAWEFSKWHTYCDCLNMMIGSGAEQDYPKMYQILSDYCQQNAYIALTAPVSLQQRLRGILFKMNPLLASKVINIFRIRKFQKTDSTTHMGGKA